MLGDEVVGAAEGSADGKVDGAEVGKLLDGSEVGLLFGAVGDGGDGIAEEGALVSASVGKSCADFLSSSPNGTTLSMSLSGKKEGEGNRRKLTRCQSKR